MNARSQKPMINRQRLVETSPRLCQGFTLVELMVGILVGTLVIAAVLALYITAIRGATAVAQETRLTQEVRISMDFMINDIRRAGYAFPHPNRVGENAETGMSDNPFMREDRDLRIHEFGSPNSCILLSFDPTFEYLADPESMQTDLSDLDDIQYVFGYRLSDGVLEMLTDAAIDSTAACNTGRWQPLTDPQTTLVETLEFDLEDSGCLNATSEDRTCTTADSGDVLLQRRVVRIELAAEHADNPETRIRLRDTVVVRNDRVFEAP